MSHPVSLLGGALAARAEVLVVQSSIPDADLPAPLAVLIDLLAQALRRDHTQNVLVLRLTDAQEDAVAVTGTDGVSRQALAVSGAADAADRVRLAIKKVFDAIVPAAAHADPDLHVLVDGALWPASLIANLKPLFDPPAAGHSRPRLLHITGDTFERPPTPGLYGPFPRIVHAALLGAPASGRLQRLDAVRLRLSRQQLASMQRVQDASFDRLDPSGQETIERLGRAVTDRRFGIALGGGGAWGYAHLPLIEAIRAAGIPIDVVSGASFGSVAGAYYCAMGLDGLAMLKTKWWALKATAAAWSSTVTSMMLSALIESDLGDLALEDLEVPLLPVASNIADGTQWITRTGKVSTGVRASGSFPGIFSPTLFPGGLCVDGAIVNNVPDSVLPRAGAFMTVASNICALPPPVDVPSWALSWPGQLLYGLNPIRRINDLVRSSFILIHEVGNLDGVAADVCFDTDWVQGTLPPSFIDFQKILDEATPKVAAIMPRIIYLWTHLNDQPSVGGARAIAPPVGPPVPPMPPPLGVAPPHP